MPAAKQPKPPALPKNLAACADLYYEVNQKRLAADKVAAELKAEEVRIKEHIIANLPVSQASGIAGKLVRVQIVPKERLQPEDWHKIYAGIVADYTKHVKKKTGQEDGAFAVLQRRLGEQAVNEIIAALGEMPGVKVEKYKSLSVSKL